MSVFRAHLHFRHRNQLGLDVARSLRVVKLHWFWGWKQAHITAFALAEITGKRNNRRLEGPILSDLTTSRPETLRGHDLPAKVI